jgi:hypothetical protein
MSKLDDKYHVIEIDGLVWDDFLPTIAYHLKSLRIWCFLCYTDELEYEIGHIADEYVLIKHPQRSRLGINLITLIFFCAKTDEKTLRKMVKMMSFV